MATDFDRAFCSWQHENMSNQQDSEDKMLPQMLDHGSISLGRYDFESLNWERRSVFNHDRRKEELEKLKAPGLVAQKKAYFEEYYKRIRAMKSLQISNDNEDESLNHSETSTYEGTRGESSSVECDEADIRGNLRNLSILEEGKNNISSSRNEEADIDMNRNPVELLQDNNIDEEQTQNSEVGSPRNLKSLELRVNTSRKTRREENQRVQASTIRSKKNLSSSRIMMGKAEIKKNIVESNRKESLHRKDRSSSQNPTRKSKISSTALNSSQSAPGNNRNSAPMLKTEQRNKLQTDNKPRIAPSQKQFEQSKIDARVVFFTAQRQPSSPKTRSVNRIAFNGTKSAVLEKKRDRPSVNNPKYGMEVNGKRRATAKNLKPVQPTPTAPGSNVLHRKIPATDTNAIKSRREHKPWR